MDMKEVLNQWAACKQVVTVSLGDEDAYVLIQGTMDMCYGMYTVSAFGSDAAVTFNADSVTKIDGLIIEIDMSKETE